MRCCSKANFDGASEALKNRTISALLLLLIFIVFVVLHAVNTSKQQTSPAGSSPATFAVASPIATYGPHFEKEPDYIKQLKDWPPAPKPSAAYLPTATPAPATYRVIGISRGDYLNVREGAGANYPVVARLEPDTRGITLGTKRTANGETTWQEISVGGHSAG